jgi:acetoin utilization protein AcuB
LLVKELITNNIPVLNPGEKGQTALSWMEMMKISHLPVVKEEEYLGLISDKIIYDGNLLDDTLDKQVLLLHTPHIHGDKHIFEAASVMYNLELSVLPVLSEDHKYLGTVTYSDVSRNITRLLCLHEPGGIIVLNIPEHSYSLNQISQITEGNDTRVLSLVTHKPSGSEMMQVTLKLDRVDLSGVIQTLERYSYQIDAVYMDDSLIHDLYEDRLEQFLRYLNI